MVENTEPTAADIDEVSGTLAAGIGGGVKPSHLSPGVLEDKGSCYQLLQLRMQELLEAHTPHTI